MEDYEVLRRSLIVILIYRAIIIAEVMLHTLSYRLLDYKSEMRRNGSIYIYIYIYLNI